MNLPHSGSFILKSDERIQTYKDNPTYTGNPDALCFARDFHDVAEILKECNERKLPVTFCGSRTSLTGSSSADSGLVVALEKKDRFLDVWKDPKTGEVLARAEPGVLLGDFKARVAEAGLRRAGAAPAAQAGYFYPPDPTSYKEAQLGGTVATNATGEDTFLYGPTRQYVRELKILTATGEERILKRSRMPVISSKNRAGYFLEGEAIDEMIGSEGTLGLITEVTCAVLPHSRGHFSLLIPFNDFLASIEFVVKTVQSSLKPRAVELIGPGAFEIFAKHPDAPRFPEGTKSVIYLKQEYQSDGSDKPPGGKSDRSDEWLQWVEAFYRERGHPDWSESIFFGESEKQKDDIRTWRHHIPATVNEEARRFHEEGGGKISTDWWVPIHQLLPMMEWVYAESLRLLALKIPFLVFAHIGNGHPHWNFLTKNSAEKRTIHDFVLEQCRRAVKSGGGVAGEHGLGKIHRDYLPIQHSRETIARMVALKKKWDPNWILGRGNILPLPTP
ncbi:MAG: FAD-binding oxidoreductase [Deltaproteobacteria bacterium]|nr:FAD-binding oxidoreductase [Deltaproteobacteria bacterium]